MKGQKGALGGAGSDSIGGDAAKQGKEATHNF